VRTKGCAIEARINAEDPVKFFPSPGTITTFDTPVPADGLLHDGVRVDAGVRAGDTVTPHYDSMLAKLIAVGDTRAEAIARLAQALSRFKVAGVKTNIPLHQRVLASEAFARGELDTHFLERLPA
jgi:acetyl-CoA carboxylase biotin carboxylase subunit